MVYFIIDNLETAFPMIDFTSFTDYELFMSKVVVNFLVYFFIFLIASFIFRIVVRMR